MGVLVPPFRIALIEWGANTTYATRRATQSEIEDILIDPKTVFRRNLPGRAATHVAQGRTSAGRPLVVAFIYKAGARAAVPINAWERS